MIIRKRKNAILFILNQALDSRVKMLNLANALLFLFIALFLLNKVVLATDYSKGFWFMIIISLLCLICFYRFINKALLSERLLVDEKKAVFISKQLFKIDSSSYETGKMINFRYLEKKVMAPHPLAGKTIDYLGFQTTEVLINQLDGDKQLAFDYKGQTVLFGTDIYEYEFDEIKSALDRFQLKRLSDS
jgi:hypothetical protein